MSNEVVCVFNFVKLPLYSILKFCNAVVFRKYYFLFSIDITINHSKNFKIKLSGIYKTVKINVKTSTRSNCVILLNIVLLKFCKLLFIVSVDILFFVY